MQLNNIPIHDKNDFVKMREAGISFTIYERGPNCGATWYHNTYPEAAKTLQDGSALFVTMNDDNSILGDINEDGVLDVLDVVNLVNAVLSQNYSLLGDMNQDGLLDVLDIVLLVNAVLN